MPCQISYGEILEEDARLAREKSEEFVKRFGIDMSDRNLLTRVACKAFQKLEESNLLLELDYESLKWWNTHKILDQERQEKEEARRKERLHNEARRALKQKVDTASVEQLERIVAALKED